MWSLASKLPKYLPCSSRFRRPIVGSYQISRPPKVETPADFEAEDAVFESENEDSAMEDTKIQEVNEVEEIKVVTKLTMPSRRLKVKISAELLQELEKMQINFKLN